MRSRPPMILFTRQSRRAVLALLLLSALILVAQPPGPVLAAPDASIAMSGTFYSQAFELPQGVELSNDSVYVVVFNEGASKLTVHLAPAAPDGVELLLPENDFLLEPGQQKQISVGVRVGQDVLPGQYELTVTATAGGSGSGVQILGGVAQKASLKVTGDSGWIAAAAVSPTGGPVVADVRLFRENEGASHELAASSNGILEAKVALGHYVVRAYVDGTQLAEQSVDIATPGERKEVSLVVETIYFANFGVVPSYDAGTHDLASASVVYQVSNVYRKVDNVRLTLGVSHDGKKLEEVPLLSLDELNVGDVGGSQKYIPPQGWENGTYTFQASLYVGEELYATTSSKDLKVAISSGRLPTVWLIPAAVVGVVIVALAVFLVIRVIRRPRLRKSP